MKYLLLKINSLNKKYIIKYFLIYLIIITFSLLFFSTNEIDNIKTLYASILGYGKFFDLHFVLKLTSIFTIGFFFYVSVTINYIEIKESNEFILLRIKRKEYYLVKLLLILAYSILYRLIAYILLSLIIYIKYSVLYCAYRFLVKDIIILLMINTITLLVITVKHRKY